MGIKPPTHTTGTHIVPTEHTSLGIYLLFGAHSTFQLLEKPWSQELSLLPPGSCLQLLIAHRVEQSRCSSFFHRALLTHAFALSASQLDPKEKSQRIYSSITPRGLEQTKLTHTRLEDNLIRHRGDRLHL